ncbi:hypothetical protein WDU94_015308 [Cyamophila willieti]
MKVSCFFPNFHFPRLPSPAKDKPPTRSPQDVMEICWGDKKLTISPRGVSTLIEYFRLCSNAVYVLSSPEEPLMLSLLRNKIYETLPDVNKAFLYGTIGYEQASGIQKALDTVDRYMVEKRIPPKEHRTNRWLKINTTITSKMFRSRVTNIIREVSFNPCQNLVILDGIDKKNNASVKFIPTPYLDDPLKPKFMAIPFTKRSLYDVAKTESVGILTRYYLQSEQCLSKFSNEDVARFKQNMYSVIVNKFLPVIKADPYRIIPGYAGLLEILTDVAESIENSNQTEDTILPFVPSQIQFKQPHPPRLKKKHMKQLSGQHCDSDDWVWDDGDSCSDTCPDDSDMNKYYRWLLIILTAICVFNCLFCVSTVGYYLFLRRRCLLKSAYPYAPRAKRDASERHCTSDSERSQSTMWISRAKEILCEGRLCCPKNGKDCKDTSSCHGNREQAASTRSCGPGCGVQQIKCPHNLVSPRPSFPQDTPYCYPARYIGMRPGEISLFKTPPRGSNVSTRYHQVYRCNTGTKQSEEEAVQSIQGCEEFQRIMRELKGLNRSFQDVLPRTHPAEWND